jgi:hypothetical protein
MENLFQFLKKIKNLKIILMKIQKKKKLLGLF